MVPLMLNRSDEDGAMAPSSNARCAHKALAAKEGLDQRKANAHVVSILLSTARWPPVLGWGLPKRFTLRCRSQAGARHSSATVGASHAKRKVPIVAQRLRMRITQCDSACVLHVQRAL